jgi:hypothetical protein
MEKLLRDGLISYRQDGKFKRYYVGENARVIIQRLGLQTP